MSSNNATLTQKVQNLAAGYESHIEKVAAKEMTETLFAEVQNVIIDRKALSSVQEGEVLVFTNVVELNSSKGDSYLAALFVSDTQNSYYLSARALATLRLVKNRNQIPEWSDELRNVNSFQRYLRDAGSLSLGIGLHALGRTKVVDYTKPGQHIQRYLNTCYNGYAEYRQMLGEGMDALMAHRKLIRSGVSPEFLALAGQELEKVLLYTPVFRVIS